MYGQTADIETLKVGDTVVTKYGKQSTISSLNTRAVDESIVNIHTSGLPSFPLRITGNHKVWIWRPKSKSKPSRLIFENAEKELQYIPAEELTLGDWTVEPRPVFADTTTDWDYSPFICGLYVAEGCLVHRYLSDGKSHIRDVQFTLGSHEHTLIERLVCELVEYTGVQPKVYNNPKRPDVTIIRIHSPELALWLHDKFGELSHNKRLPEDLFHLHTIGRLEFIGAYIDGDGHVWKQGDNIRSMRLASCSQYILWQVMTLALSCGLTPTLMQSHQTEDGYGAPGAIYYTLVFNKCDLEVLAPFIMKAAGMTTAGKGRTGSVTVKGNYVYRKIARVERESFKGLVYNLEVKDEHSYVANRCCVSNCTNGAYRSAARKVVRYFLTELVLDGESEKERDEYTHFLADDLHIMTVLAEIGDDFQAYGNCFVSIYFPFDRFLICPKCLTEYHVETIKYKFNLANKSFFCTCPNKECNYEGDFRRDDRRSLDRSKLFIKRWNPKLMRIRWHHITGEMEYYMEFEPIYLSKIVDGVPFYLDRTPWDIIECIGDTHKAETPLFKFERGSLYHLHELTLAGLPIRGWGVPPVIPNFKLAYYIQILRKYDEAIAFDFIVPHRIIYPDSNSMGPGGMDALQSTSMSLFNSFMQNMIKNHRKDPTDLQAAPFKIGYQMIGGEGKSLAPKESIALATDELLNAIGIPAELYKGSLSLQSAPVALRLFEKSQGTMVEGFNDLIGWMIKGISKHFNWGDVTGKLRSVTLADDMERKALALQAAAGQDISKATAYKPLGLNFMEEQKKVIDEQQKIQELQREAQEEQQAMEAQQGGGEGGQQQSTPGDVYTQGKQIAYQLVTQTPEGMRRGELMKIKQSNPTLHAIVLQEMKVIRQDMARQGQAMMMQQAQQGGQKTASYEIAKKLPSVVLLDTCISSALCEYNRHDLRKIAADVTKGIFGAESALRFILQEMQGMI